MSGASVPVVLRRDVQIEMVSLVQRYLDGGLDGPVFNLAYWVTRRRLMDEDWGAFVGPFGVAMSSVDVAVDAYSEDPEAALSISEAQMRSEVAAAMVDLHATAPDLFADPATTPDASEHP